MKAKKLAALIVTTYISFSSTAHASAPQPVFSPEQEARIGEIAADYLVGVRLENGNYPTLRLFFVQSGIDCT